MGKPTTKKKTPVGLVSGDVSTKQSKASERKAKAFDEDTAIFVNMSQELKEEGRKLFQKRDHEGAMLKYEKAIKLLPANHIDVAYLRTNMAACYMELGIGEYPRAVNECNLALQVAPKYSKALLTRARCYEALNRLELALNDVNLVLSMEPQNSSALDFADSLKRTMEEKGLLVKDKEIVAPPQYVEPTYTPVSRKVVKETAKKKKSVELDKKNILEPEEKKSVTVKSESKNILKPEEKKSIKFDKKNTQDMEEKKKSIKFDKKNTQDMEEKKKSTKFDGKNIEEPEEKNVDAVDEKEAEDKVIVEEKISAKEEKEVMKSVKLVHGEDIRWAQLPINCGVRLVRDIVVDRFPSLKGVLIKYKDQEGDLITITTTDELRTAEGLADHQGPLRLYIVEVSPEKEPTYGRIVTKEELDKSSKKPPVVVTENSDVDKGSSCVEHWILQFARLFKNHVGFDCDSYLDLHEIGMKLYSEAMEDAVSSEDAQKLFDIAAAKFQEMTALALFNWGNVHLSKARKRENLPEGSSSETIISQIKAAYDWALKEYTKAGKRYEEALKLKPDFYEGLLALGLQQFEQAKLCWYYITGSKADLEIGPSAQVLELYNKAEDSMEKGMQIWEEMEEQRLNGLSKYEQDKSDLRKLGLGGLFKDVSDEEASEQAANMRSQIYLLWGTLLYERSVVEYKLGLPTWEECLEVAVEKFELAGASETEIAVMIKNHCSNISALEGFKVDEIVQAWNDMYDADRWLIGVASFRLEPLFRRRSPNLHSVLEHL